MNLLITRAFDRKPDPKDIPKLVCYLQGVTDGMNAQKPTPLAAALADVTYWMDKLDGNVCRHGIVGCLGGDKCTSDHK